MLLAKVEKATNLPPHGKYETAAGCHSPAVVLGSDGNTCMASGSSQVSYYFIKNV